MATYRKLGRETAHRNLMLRNLVTDLLREGRIETTVTRAKETRRMAEKMITLAKRGDLHARRQVLAYVLDETVVSNLFTEIAPKYAERNGGYTRIIKKGPRRGDAAEMAFIELVYTEIAPKYAERNGGYTRIIKKGPRRGDAAEMAFIELV